MNTPTNRSVKALLVAVAGMLALTSGAPAFAASRAQSVVPATVKVKPLVINPCANPAVTTVAAMNNTKYAAVIRVYAEPSDAKDPVVTLGVGIEIKGAPVFTVNRVEGDWMNVNVPMRPNGLTGWIKSAEVHTYSHKWAMRVELKAKKLTVCNAGRAVQTEKIAVGKPATPTPVGRCFTVELVRPIGGSKGAYGPYAFGLSCFSNQIFQFAKTGDGRLGIHGTNAPGALGTAASSGCIRVGNTGITKMAKTLPLGVPVDIVD